MEKHNKQKSILWFFIFLQCFIICRTLFFMVFIFTQPSKQIFTSSFGIATVTASGQLIIVFCNFPLCFFGKFWLVFCVPPWLSTNQAAVCCWLTTYEAVLVFRQPFFFMTLFFVGSLLLEAAAAAAAAICQKEIKL